MQIRFYVVASAFILVLTSSQYALAQQVDCSILDPRASVSSSLDIKISASADTLYKIAKAGVGFESKAKTEIENLQKGAPITEQGAVKLRTLYLFCGMVANAQDISTERKVQLYTVMMNIKKEGIPVEASEQHLIPKTSGFLLPGTKRLPKGAAQIPKGAFAIFLGNSLAYTTSFPHTVIEVGGVPALVINKNKAGITIFAKFFSEDGRIVAELKDTQFYVNPNNYFRIERPNNHALIVYDQMGQQALNVEFLNPFAIKLLGKFYFPPRQPIIIEEKQLSYLGFRISGARFGENLADIIIK